MPTLCRTRTAYKVKPVHCKLPPPPPLSLSHTHKHTVTTDPEKPLNVTVAEPLQCREGFFRQDPSSFCEPSCHSWLQYPKAESIFIDVVVFLTAFIGFVVAIVVLVISVVRRKRM